MLEPADDNGVTPVTRAITPIDESYSTSFEYNAGGIRTKKIWFNPITDVTTTTEYKLSGTTILSETTMGAYNRTIRYIYTNNELVGFECNGNAYYYRKNLFGDIVEIYDSSNNLVASYTYDAWGNCTFGANVDNIANVNPFRYRGYYYDWETRYYYLQTRYYDAEVGRFLNADDIKYLNPTAILGCNIYAYCGDNPIANTDRTGTIALSPWLKDVANWLREGIEAVGEAVEEFFDSVGDAIEGAVRQIVDAGHKLDKEVQGVLVQGAQKYIEWKVRRYKRRNDIYRKIEGFFVSRYEWARDVALPAVGDFVTQTVWEDWIVGGVWEGGILPAWEWLNGDAWYQVVARSIISALLAQLVATGVVAILGVSLKAGVVFLIGVAVGAIINFLWEMLAG